MRFSICVAMGMLAGSLGSARALAEENSVYGKLGVVISTDKGDIKIDLFPDEAPLTVTSFLNLARRGYYDGLIFHRVIPNFMIQGGDPTGTGRGGPGYKFKNECTPKRRHDSAGILSMANAGPGTNGSQFFITHNETLRLDGKHTVFGKVTSGQDVVDAISKGDKMNKVTIVGDPTALFEANSKQFSNWNKVLDAKAGSRNASKGLTAQALKVMKKTMSEFTDTAVFASRLEETKKKATTTASGLMYVDTQVGEGASPSPTDRVTVHYTGWLTDGTKFDSSVDRGNPSTFGLNQVIKGWTEGVGGMKVGGIRMLLIPADLAYGDRSKPSIPANSTLLFEVALISIG